MARGPRAHATVSRRSRGGGGRACVWRASVAVWESVRWLVPRAADAKVLGRVRIWRGHWKGTARAVRASCARYGLSRTEMNLWSLCASIVLLQSAPEWSSFIGHSQRSPRQCTPTSRRDAQSWPSVEASPCLGGLTACPTGARHGRRRRRPGPSSSTRRATVITIAPSLLPVDSQQAPSRPVQPCPIPSALPRKRRASPGQPSEEN